MNENEPGDLGPATRLAHAGRRSEWTGMPGQPGGIVNPPVWRASTILYEDVAHLRAATKDTHQRLFYGRKGTPTSWALAEAINGLEPESAGTFIYPSGVAAIAGALLAVLRPGDELLMVDSAYDPSRSMCNGLLADFGVKTIFYDPLIGSGIEALCTERTRAIFMESPGSLTFEVQDIPAIVAVARRRGITTLIDNTWATPLLLPAMGLGVDISIIACTKYVVGHSDVMMGSVSANAAHWPAIRDRAFGLGQMVSPDDAWLALRGLRTLDLRLKRHGESALKVAQWLAARDEVALVNHPSLPGSGGHESFVRDFNRPAGLFSFALKGGCSAQADKARAALIDTLALFGIGYSWGGFESLALPVDPGRYRSATRFDPPGFLVRLSIGLEDADDLIADLERGLAAWREAMDSAA